MTQRHTGIVLTFPGHFLSTALTISSIKKHITGVKEIIVLVDTWNADFWPDYLECCKNLYNLPIVDLKSFKKLELFDDDPWLRQQMTKLHLDEIVSLQNWFFADGDVKFFYDVSEECVPYTFTKFEGVPLHIRDPEPGENTSQQLFYINKLLFLNSTGLHHNNKRICTSGVPFRDMDAKTLTDIRTFIKQKHSVSAIEIHKQIRQDLRYSITEWELIEHFKKYVQGKNLSYTYYPVGQFNEQGNQGKFPWFVTHWGCDKDLGDIYWWKNQGVEIDKKIWQKLPTTKYM